MESMDLKLFDNIYRGKKVLLTGDTGFKGSWMAFWLQYLGADVEGYSLSPHTTPNHYSILNPQYKTHFHNICDYAHLTLTINATKPDIIFHLAAQSLVRYSYQHPIETYQTNMMGTINVLEAARYCESVKAIVVVTSDKCYENLEQNQGFTESDKMGGFDPYSSSKGCVELIVNAYRNSFFNTNEFNKSHQTLIATARAGNVIGGGDWSDDRLIPDIVRSAIVREKTNIRFPHATRPWQHVLEPISGYLLLGEKLLKGMAEYAGGWNFGPDENEILTVKEVLELAKGHWEKIEYTIDTSNNHWHEAKLLSLNIDKAKNMLLWQPKWSSQQAISVTIQWYRDYYENAILNTESDLHAYLGI